MITRPMSWQELKEALAHSITTHSYTLPRLRRLHARSISSGLRLNLYISTLLVTKYFHFGDAGAARLVFNSHRGRPIKPLLLNSLIKGYLRIGSPRCALDAYQEMAMDRPGQCEPDKQTFHLAITACTHLSEIQLGTQIGDHARSNGLVSDLLVATALIRLYSKAGDIEHARNLFDEMHSRDVVSWNAMISGYSQTGNVAEAIDLFKTMRFAHGFTLTEATLVSLISGCGNSGSLKEGEVVHAYAIKIGFGDDQFVSNSLLAMYLDCNCLDVAVKLFGWMGNKKDAISWSTMIGGYLHYERSCDALKLFHWMAANTGTVPTRPILLNVLLACANLGDWQEGKWVEENYLRDDSGKLESDASLITTLVYMYAKSGKIEISLKIFDEDAQRRGDVISWNALMKAFVELKQIDCVLELTLRMYRSGINPDHVTFLLLLSAISSIPCPRKGLEIHAQIMRRGIQFERTISNSLIDMYAKSGCIQDAYKVYDGIIEKDVVSWSSIIRAYALNGYAEDAIHLFQLMRKTIIRPNHVTFLAVLSACCHVGFVEKGRQLFENMKDYGLEPDIEHFACMIDIFCRAGRVKDAYQFLQNGMPKVQNSYVLWGTLLSACRLHGDPIIGEGAARHLFYLEPRNSANYLMLADIYISSGQREDANAVLRLLREKGLEKRPGCSWFEPG